jgi:carboxyl-terminal processing protease
MHDLRSPRKSSRTPFRAAGLCGLLLVLFSLGLQAKTPMVPESQLVPAQRHMEATDYIIHIIQTYHYKNKPLNDALSSQILDAYLENLDPNRSFFTMQDVQDFNKYRYKLDDDLKDDDLDPAFKIFRLFRHRVDDRVSYALKILNTDKFNFNVDEDYRFDRRKAAWADNEKALDKIWRERVKNDWLSLLLADKKPDSIKDTLSKRYKRLRTSTFQLNSNDVFQSFINAYTMSIEPHTAYFSPRTSENFDISMRLSLEGIGAVLRGETDYTTVQEIIPGGPADISHELHAEDKIIGVGQGKKGKIVDVIGWRLDDVVDRIRGPKGSVVRLEIIPKGTGVEGPNKVITLTRDEIKLEEQAAKSDILTLPSGRRFGVIDVPTFYSDFAAHARGDKNYTSTTRDVRKLLAELKKKDVSGIIIDLRGNGGGSLSEALEMTGLFIDKGPIVQTKDATGRIDINRDPEPGIDYGGPLAVLVDRNSASASEIFAGAIQDYHRGIIIGEPTFGKGTVQSIVDLNRFIRDSDEDHGRLKTTVAQFFRVSGSSNQHRGVIPDVIYPTADKNDDQGERGLPNALPWEQIKPARYTPANAPIDQYDRVRRQFQERIKHEKLFQLLLKEHKMAEEVNEQTTVSLMESKRKDEREKMSVTRHELQNEFRKAQGLKPIPMNAPEEEYEKIKPVDILLNECARILQDLITPTPEQRTASNLPS